MSTADGTGPDPAESCSGATIAAAVAIDKADITNDAVLPAGATVTANGATIHALMHSQHELSANATSGASGGSVGLAGALAIELEDIETIASLSGTLDAGSGDVSIAAASDASSSASALPADGTTSASSVGIGASVALGIVDDATTAQIDGALVGGGDVTLSATTVHGLAVHAKTGAAGGDVAIVPSVAIALSNITTTAAVTSGTALAILALSALVLVSWVGAGRAIKRFSKISSHEIPTDRRISMFRGAARIFFDHPVKGCGLGTLVDVYPRYETSYDGKLVDHVHNDYIEALAETGILGGLWGLAFLWLFFREARKHFTAEQGHFSRALHAAAIAAVSGLLVHSFVDFNLHIPSNALFFLLQAYVATSPPLPSNALPSRRRRAAPDVAVVKAEAGSRAN